MHRFRPEEVAGNVGGHWCVAAAILTKVDDDRIEIGKCIKIYRSRLATLVEVRERPQIKVADVSPETLNLIKTKIEAFAGLGRWRRRFGRSRGFGTEEDSDMLIMC